MTSEETEWSEERLLRLTSAEDIERACRELCAREAATQTALRTWLARQRPADTRDLFAQADAFRVPEQSPAVAALRQSLDTLCCASAAPVATARRVAATVRAVATVEARVGATAERVQELIDLKHCLGRVQAARASGDIAAAVRGIHRYLALDAAVLDEPSRRLLATTRAELQHALGDRVTAAIHTAEEHLQQQQQGQGQSPSVEEDEEQVRALCALYGTLGAEDEGLARYTQYVRARIEAVADAVFADLATLRADTGCGAGDLAAFEAGGSAARAPAHVASFGAGLTHICEAIADVVQRLVHSDDAARPLWPGSAFSILCEVQSLSDSLGSRLCDMFYSCFSVNQRMAEIQSRRNTDMKASPKQLGPMLDEMVLLCQTANVLDGFLRREYSAARQVYAAWLTKQQQESARQMRPGSTAPRGLDTFQTLARSTELLRRAQELSSNYLFLEEYNLSETVSSTLASEALSPDTVELLFYVLNTCASRSVQTLNSSCVCAVINAVTTALSGPIYQTMERALKEGTVRGLLKMRPSASQTTQAWTRLNCVDLVVADIPQLCDSLRAQCAQYFASAPRTVQKLGDCLGDVAAAGKRFRVLLSEGLEQQCRQAMLPRLRAAVEAVVAARPTYVLSQDDYALLDAGDTPFAQLGVVVVQCVADVAPLLSAANHEAVLLRAVAYAADKLEALVFQRRFNQLGALQLDTDLRAFQQQLAALARRGVRDKCARLAQIALFLGVEHPAEAPQLWASGAGTAGTTWRLAPAEVRRVLALRTDFRPEQLRRLVF